MGDSDSTQMCLNALVFVCTEVKQEKRREEGARMRVGDAINLYQSAHAWQMNMQTIGRGSAVSFVMPAGGVKMERVVDWVEVRLGLTCGALPALLLKTEVQVSASRLRQPAEEGGGVKISG